MLRARGLTPCHPTAIASQRPFRSRVWGEEEQGARAAPEDHLTSYPGTGRKSALLGRVRTCQGACLVSSPTSGRPRTSASPHPGPALTLGWSVHHARRGIRTVAPGSCAERRAAVSPRISSPRHAQKNTSRRARHAPYAYIINPKNLSPPQLSSRGLSPGSSHPLAPWISVWRTPGSERCASNWPAEGAARWIAGTSPAMTTATTRVPIV